MTEIEHHHDRRGSALERHAQTIGISLITIALVWVGATLRDMYDAQITQREAMLSMQTGMDEIKLELRDVRAKVIAMPTNREIDARFDAMGRRIDALERQR